MKATSVGTLTKREREVIGLIAQGCTNREISAALVITLSTAERHVANILKKLGARSRSEVAIWATANIALGAGAHHVRRPEPHLPEPLASFVGRQAGLAEIRDLVAASRLVTLTGPGGIGKTRLALEVARERQASFSDGARFVDLVPVSDPGLIASAIAAAMFPIVIK